MRAGWSVLLGLGLAAAAVAQPAAVRAIEKKFAEAKPTEAELAFFGLSWECDLAAAKARAKAEGRPIVAVLVHNITASCDFYSGHT